MKPLAILLLLTLCSCSALKPTTPYTKAEKAMYAGMVACNVWDYDSTRRSLDRGNVEANPLLGSNPNDGELAAFKLASIGLFTVLANKTEGKYRKIILGLGSFTSCGAAIHNENQ